MTKEFNYISDQDLEQLISQVEQNELVTAPPDLMESILTIVELNEEDEKGTMESSSEVITKVIPIKTAAARKKEFYAYCFRVVTSVAAAIALVFLLPEMMSGMAGQEANVPEFSKQEVPNWEEVADTVPSREEVVLTEQTPTREEVLNGTDFIERILNNTGWFNTKNSGE